MSYIGNTSSVQQYAPQVAYFSGDASTVAFTLPVSVVSAAQIIVSVANVIQNPSSAFTVSGTTLTFTSAPPSGTNNIWVQYTTLQSNIVTPAAASVGLTQLSATGTPSSSNYLRGDNSWTSLTSSQWTTTGSDIYYNSGKVGFGTTTPQNTVEVYNGSDTQVRLRNGGVSTQSYDFGRNGGTGLLNFYGNQTGYTGYVFGGVDGTRMTIDSSGRVTKPYQPSFRACKSGSTTGTSENPVQYDTVDYNIGSHYNNSTYRFTAPVAGRYFFSAQFSFYQPGDARQIEAGLKINGGVVQSGDCFVQVTQSNNTHMTLTITTILNLSAGDYVQGAWISSTASINFYSPAYRNSFCGYLVG